MPHEIDRYALPAVVTVAGIHQLVLFTKAVGEARKKYNVKPPETTGPPEFLRTYRAHQNTLEFYPVSLTSLWIGSVFFHPVPSSILYAGYLIGRKKYFSGYVEDAEKRGSGFKISIRCLLGLVILCVLGVGHKTIRYFQGADVLKIAHHHCKF
uniref:Microsomal glutathione S-transferase 2 n=1 Tax=Arion vulgaris TaxID=1028688 RepID=A0A0B7ALJ5_9EUPU